jgi:hypothetical protein
MHKGLWHDDPLRDRAMTKGDRALLSSAEEWNRNEGQMTPSELEQEMNRQRGMAGDPGHASVGPPESRMSSIWNHLRHGIPRRVERFLEPETPAEMAGLLGASVAEPYGTAIDLADFAIGVRDRDPARMGLAAAGAVVPFAGAAGIKGLLRGSGAKAADELPMDEASRMGRAESRYPSVGYHGTTADISEFSGPTWITDDPRVASHYASRTRAGDILEEGIGADDEFVGGVDELDPYALMEFFGQEGGQNVMPLRYGAGDVLDMTELGVIPKPEDLLSWLKDRKIIEFEYADIGDWLDDLTVDGPALWKMIEDWGLEVDIKNAGFGGLRIEDIVASDQRGAMGTIGHTSTLVFDPKNIRSSTAAAFNPAQAESANLIAGGAGLLGAGLARNQRERK